MANTEHAHDNAASHIESIRALWIAYRVATGEAELEDYENTDEQGRSSRIATDRKRTYWNVCTSIPFPLSFGADGIRSGTRPQ